MGAKHRPGFPSSLFDRLSEYSIGLPGQKIVDLGTDTGTLARGLGARGSDMIELDRSAAMLEQARQLSESAQLKVDYRVATAEDTGLPSASADVGTAGQCWHWFDGLRAVQ